MTSECLTFFCATQLLLSKRAFALPLSKSEAICLHMRSKGHPSHGWGWVIKVWIPKSQKSHSKCISTPFQLLSERNLNPESSWSLKNPVPPMLASTAMPVSTYKCRGFQARLVIHFLWPVNVWPICFPVLGSHIITCQIHKPSLSLPGKQISRHWGLPNFSTTKWLLSPPKGL